MRTEQSSTLRPQRLSLGPVDGASVITFLALAFGLSWACFIGLRALGAPFDIPIRTGEFGPAAAALLTVSLRGEPFSGLALWPRWSYAYAYAYALPILLTVGAISLAILVGYQHWDLLHTWQVSLTSALRHASTARVATMRRLSGAPLLWQFLWPLTVGVVVDTFIAMGEELGWRGFLLPRLRPLAGLSREVGNSSSERRLMCSP